MSLSKAEQRWVAALSARHSRVRVFKRGGVLNLTRNPIGVEYPLPRRFREHFIKATGIPQ
jgi:hypothetical protein